MVLSSDSSDKYTSTVQSSPLSANAAIPPHPRLQTSYPPSAHYVSSPSAPSPPFHAPGCPFAHSASSPPDSLRVLQWNAGGLQAKSTELLHFLSSHSVDLICTQECNLNLSSSFRIPGFSTLHFDRAHSRNGILSPDATHASGGVIIFVRQGLSFSELSTSSLSLLDSYSDYTEVNISLSNSSLLSFFNMYASPIRSFPKDGKSDSFPPFVLSSSRNLSFLGISIAITPSGTQEVLPTPAEKKYSTGSSLLTSSPSMTLTHPPSTLLHWQSLLP